MIYQLNVGRCEDVLCGMADNSVDSIVTDPPYGLSFMGHKWDYQVPTVDQWAECLRVLKPGGHLLAFGGARTYHRLVVNIEDAGFEIRDQLMWIYGSGFPKSKNLTGDNQGKGTALKPAHEPIVMARKPLVGTVEGNVVQFGTGALNIDLCRVPTEEALTGGAGGLLSHVRDEKASESGEWKADQLGRWPANVLHDGSEEVITEFPQNAGARAPVKGTEPTANGFSGPVKFGGMIDRVASYHHGDQGSAARFFYCAKVSKSERDEGMERFVPYTASDMTGGRKEGSAGLNDPRAGAGRTGGARNIRDLIAPGKTGSSTIYWVQQTGFTNKAAAVPENTAKPYSDIQFAEKITPVRTLAHMFKASKQILDDFAQLQSTVDAELRFGLKYVEEQEILFGDGTGAHLEGIMPQASKYKAAFEVAMQNGIDDLRLAMLQAQLARFPSTGHVLHFTDWAKIELLKDTLGRYILANPSALVGPTLWGLPVVATEASAFLGKFLTGAFSAGAQLFDREEANVVISTENADDFEKNMISIRCEERVALAVKRPEAFVTGAFTVPTPPTGG